jgi:hypothetical protein
MLFFIHFLSHIKVKLGGTAAYFQVAWAGPGLLATSCKERVARYVMWS